MAQAAWKDTHAWMHRKVDDPDPQNPMHSTDLVNDQGEPWSRLNSNPALCLHFTQEAP